MLDKGQLSRSIYFFQNASSVLTSPSRSIQVFRKYSNSLGPDALSFLEQVLDAHEIEDQDVESSIEALAKEYNKQDGVSQYNF